MDTILDLTVYLLLSWFGSVANCLINVQHFEIQNNIKRLALLWQTCFDEKQVVSYWSIFQGSQRVIFLAWRGHVFIANIKCPKGHMFRREVKLRDNRNLKKKTYTYQKHWRNDVMNLHAIKTLSCKDLCKVKIFQNTMRISREKTKCLDCISIYEAI